MSTEEESVKKEEVKEEQLTEKQLETLRDLKEHKNRHGTWPHLKAIAEKRGVGTNSIYVRVLALEKKGYLKILGRKKYEVLEGGRGDDFLSDSFINVRNQLPPQRDRILLLLKRGKQGKKTLFGWWDLCGFHLESFFDLTQEDVLGWKPAPTERLERERKAAPSSVSGSKEME